MPQPAKRSEVLRKRVERFARALNGLEAGDVPALHRVRVASRRLRELVPMLQLDHDVTRKLSRRLRRVTNRLGTVRELDVLLILIDELHVSRRDRIPAFGRIGVLVSKDRDRARKRLFKNMPAGELRRLAGRLERVATGLEVAEAAASRAADRRWRWAMDARIANRAARLESAMQEAGAVYLPERLHAVRIALKKLRYSAELLYDIAGARRDADLRTLKRGQDLLGRMHDLQILIDRVRQLQASLAPPSLTVWRDLDALIASLEDECRRLHARYMRLRDMIGAIAATIGARAAAGPARTAARRAG